jgi:hypothetical protein
MNKGKEYRTEEQGISNIEVLSSVYLFLLIAGRLQVEGLLDLSHFYIYYSLFNIFRFNTLPLFLVHLFIFWMFLISSSTTLG